MKLPATILKSLARTLAQYPKFLFVASLLYVLSPIDILPEAFLGPIGLIDDLFVVLLPFIIREYARRPEKPKPRTPPTPDVVETTRD